MPDSFDPAEYLAQARSHLEANPDVPERHYSLRLLAALEKALELHKPESGGLHGHPGLRVCDRCSSASGAQVWPCYEYEAISRALLGEERTDAV